MVLAFTEQGLLEGETMVYKKRLKYYLGNGGYFFLEVFVKSIEEIKSKEFHQNLIREKLIELNEKMAANLKENSFKLDYEETRFLKDDISMYSKYLFNELQCGDDEMYFPQSVLGFDLNKLKVIKIFPNEFEYRCYMKHLIEHTFKYNKTILNDPYINELTNGNSSKIYQTFTKEHIEYIENLTFSDNIVLKLNEDCEKEFDFNKYHNIIRTLETSNKKFLSFLNKNGKTLIIKQIDSIFDNHLKTNNYKAYELSDTLGNYIYFDSNTGTYPCIIYGNAKTQEQHSCYISKYGDFLYLFDTCEKVFNGEFVLPAIMVFDEKVEL